MTTSETLEVIARRHACRAFQDTPVSPELLRAVAEAGIRAPSAVNRQPWRLVVVSDQAQIDEIDRVGLENLKTINEEGYARVQARGGRLLYNAPAMIIIATEPLSTPFPVDMDAGIVASHLTLAATSLGLDTCVVAMPSAAFADDALRAKCIPAGFEFSVAVLLGYATEPGAPHAPDFSKITYL